MLHATGVDGPCQQHSGPVVICVSAVCNSRFNPILNPSRKDFVTSACSFGDYVTSSVSQGSHKRQTYSSPGEGRSQPHFCSQKLCWGLVFRLPRFLCPSVSPALASIRFDALLSLLFGTCWTSTFSIHANTSFWRDIFFKPI